MRHVLNRVLCACVVSLACSADEAARVDIPTQPEEEVAWEPDPDEDVPEPAARVTDESVYWSKYCEDIDLPDNFADGNPVWYLRGAERVAEGTEGAVLVYKGSRRLWYTGRPVPREKKRKGDLMVRAHAKTDEQWRKDNKRKATIVGNIMAGRGGNVLVRGKLHEHRGNFAVRHKRKQDLSAARKAYAAYKYKPERVEFLRKFIAKNDAKKGKREKVRLARAELKRRTTYKDNPSFKDFRRWRAGLGYGFVLPYFVYIMGPNEPPEMLCDPVNATYVLVNKFREIKKNLESRGIAPSYLNLLKAYGSGGDVSSRECRVEANGRKRCPDAAKAKRLRKLGVDPHEVPDLGIAGNYRYDGVKEKLDPEKRRYARKGSTCVTRKNGEPRADHVWEHDACWYDHKPKAQYLKELRELVEGHMTEIVAKREERAAKRLARRQRRRQAGA